MEFVALVVAVAVEELEVVVLLVVVEQAFAFEAPLASS